MPEIKRTFHVLGLMSGTSTDGLDIALCSFRIENKKWYYVIESAKTIPYSDEWKDKLSGAHILSANNLIELDHYYGKWIAIQCYNFLKEVPQKPDIIASHGHTVFHQPERGYTFQIGNGNEIAAGTGIPVVYDFRSLDVALGGQGAPLVPAGDELLFPEYDCCLNLGGFSNISYRYGNSRIAFDICPVNVVLNKIAEKRGFLFDKDGAMGKKGKIINDLLKKLNNLTFYKLPPPRTLMREWLETEFLPLLNNYSNPEDLMRTLYEHITDQIINVFNSCKGKKILVTGGGAKNTFLIALLKEKCARWQTIYIPDIEIIDFKEALIFGFLGLLRYLGMTNCFASVTGAKKNSSTGIIAGVPLTVYSNSE